MRLLFLAAASVAAFAIAPAQANQYLFTLTGTDTATFTLNSSPTPSSIEDGSGDGGYPYFDVDNVAGTFSGGGGSAVLANIQFYTGAAGGGLEVNNSDNFGLFSPEGASVFNDDINNPTFALGSYDFTTDFFYGPVTDHLVISDLGPDAAVPEPASWALMISGFGLVGGALRRRQSVSFAA